MVSRSNCWVSTVRLTDASLSMDPEMKIWVMETPSHMFIAGERHACETTFKKNATFPVSELDLRYPVCQKLSVTDGLLFGAHTEAGIILYYGGRYVEAVSAFNEAITLNPDSSDAWYNLGGALYVLERNEESLAAYDKAVTLNPGIAVAWYNRGNALYVLGRYDEAVDSYDNAISREPENAEALYYKSNALDELGRYAEATECLKKAVAIKLREGRKFTDLIRD